jgi:mutual gliding-motility protein MglA
MATLRSDEQLISFKIVYCGPALGGKTTNLTHVHSRLDPVGRGELLTLSTAADRTLFFDFLAIETEALPGYRTLFQLYTVPGQVTYNATLQLVLRQADAIVFVADSQMDRQAENLQSMQSLETCLRLNGIALEQLPTVIQYNKRDLPNKAPVDYMEHLLNNRQTRFPSFEAEASTGLNVLATLNTVSNSLLSRFHQRLMLEQKELGMEDRSNSSIDFRSSNVIPTIDEPARPKSEPILVA